MTILAAIGEETKSTPVVGTGYEVAEAFGEDLVVLHVVPEETFDTHRENVNSLPGSDDYSFTQEEQSAEWFAREVIEASLEGRDTDEVRAMGRVGDPKTEIVAAADEVDASYLVIGRYKRSPTGKAIFGSTTQSVLLNTDRDVVTVMDDAGP